MVLLGETVYGEAGLSWRSMNTRAQSALPYAEDLGHMRHCSTRIMRLPGRRLA